MKESVQPYLGHGFGRLHGSRHWPPVEAAVLPRSLPAQLSLPQIPTAASTESGTPDYSMRTPSTSNLSVG